MIETGRFPEIQGLYDPAREKDSCGVGLVIKIDGTKSHSIVDNALHVLEHMVHRGAEGADNKSGDGAGIMIQIPHEFILLQGIPLPERGHYATGLVFLPKDEQLQREAMQLIKKSADELSLEVLHIRDVPVNSDILGAAAAECEPNIKQIFIAGASAQDLPSRVYSLRKRIERKLIDLNNNDTYIVSLSTTNIIYKGMLSSLQLRDYFIDLSSPYLTSAIALVHSRFSTNTFPRWSLAQPFRLIGHNGEINTIKGNRSWMHTRESLLSCAAIGDMAEVCPIVQPNMSDSASLDNVLEFFIACGLSLPHAMSMLVPESHDNDKNPISPDLKAFYEYHSIFMEPWDGPAALLFSDGRYAGGMLDRNGLRPARYFITHDGEMVMASETGVIDIEPSRIKEKGRLLPGKILMVDTKLGIIIRDGQIKQSLAAEHPYRDWMARGRVILKDIPSGRVISNSIDDYDRLLQVYDYSKEDVEVVIKSMAETGAEPLGSMGNDTPLAILSSKPQRLFNYFRQQFAQVTNPPIDPIREELVMTLASYIGSIDGNILKPSADHCKVVKLSSPIITNSELATLKNLQYKGFKTLSIPMLFNANGGSDALSDAIEAMCKSAQDAVEAGYNYIIVSDRGVSPDLAPIPSVLATSAIHHHLIRVKRRSQVALVVETAEAREVMHMALILGFGASAVNPYLALGVVDRLTATHQIQQEYSSAESHYISALNKGLKKILSKMGISTMRSYRGAKIFEAVGLSQDLISKYFHGLSSSLGGINLDIIAAEVLAPLHLAYGRDKDSERLLKSIGKYCYRVDGESHAWNPDTISTLQLATRLGSYKKFEEFTNMIDNKPRPTFLRDMLSIKKGDAIPIEEVEPIESIMSRFVTGAMSFGSISKEAHEAMAVAMNIIGGKSNTGEGGEEASRNVVGADGIDRRNNIKQVASGRFGVSADYLSYADEIQIKVAQGAKPGEGGQLPGYKVDEVIAKARHAIPGISLISPPPHHDIYSIEDLSQLIFDLKNVNPRARISVKLVSETGVGIIAAGVAKAKADMILISGGDGGTGASPISSIYHAGLPVELGLAEVQQTLLLNNLRGKVRLQADGQIKTGRDIIVAAILGAEEFGFATSALIVLGCVMMRKCHENTCPVGVATQNERLRGNFRGAADYLVNFFRFLAEQTREHLAAMGYRSIDEIVGQTHLLEAKQYLDDNKLSSINLDKLLYKPQVADEVSLLCNTKQDHHIDTILDRKLIGMLAPSLSSGHPSRLVFPIANTDRSVGAMLAGEIAHLYPYKGLADDTINITFKGSAGQSFGAFLPKGVTFDLKGDANDYVGKSLSGGRIIITPPNGSTFAPEDNIIVGNTLLYGATSGEMYAAGAAGERFAVRNSGATAVVEGVGDHCCEYMTAGRVVVLGKTGRNFAAGMSGGVAYVWNKLGTFDYFCNMGMVELSLVEDSADEKELLSLIKAHYNYTGSPLAARMLASWNSYQGEFIKVMPFEYKRVLAAQRLAELEAKIARVERDY